ncbi:MAG: hypothetical protein Q8K32_07135 [Archangium sp.]|nr:hypothetical protein [Archangium sp.]
MTSYGPADSALLVEHLLPSVLGLSRELSSERNERALYFGELALTLERLRDHISVISSPRVGEASSPQYPWLWRYVGQFTVGAQGPAVQHAKLWAFLWEWPDRSQSLELVISSTNLTEAAFKGQLQAAWRVILPLEDRPSNTRLASWAALPHFLEALGRSAGPVAMKRVLRIRDLLARCICPDGVVPIASIPGEAGAARALAKHAPVDRGHLRMHVLTPTIGRWNKTTLGAWCRDAGAKPEHLKLKWIDRDHDWVQGGGWQLPRVALDTFAKSGVNVERLGSRRNGPPCCFHDRHAAANDDRWSHAKLYLLQRGRVRRLLITSANWSVSAWGAGSTPPQNFELGVLIDAHWPLENDSLAFSDQLPPHVVEQLEVLTSGALTWAEATWDGTQIQLKARSSDSQPPVQATVALADGAVLSRNLRGGTGALDWSDPLNQPRTATFVQGSAVIETAVLDLRPAPKFSQTPLPEMDPAVAAAIREALLLEQYGGPVVEADTIGALLGETASSQAAHGGGDYAVAAYVAARAGFAVVDAWCEARRRVRDAGGNGHERVRHDGVALQAIYERRAASTSEGMPASLIAEEFRWHLEGDDGD